MQFGGLLGEVTLAGPTLPDLWPAFWLGQWTHLGKGTAMGLGGYRVVEAQTSGVAGRLDHKLVTAADWNLNGEHSPDGDPHDSH